MSSVKSLSGKRNLGSSQEEVIELTNQFYVTLRAYFAKVKQDAAARARNQVAFDRIEELLQPDANQNWTHAYEVEQLLIHLFGDGTVQTELGVRALEAKSILRPEAAASYDTQIRELAGDTVTPADANERRRTILSRLVNDLQWRYIVNEATRRYSKAVTRRTAIFSSLALVCFLVLVFALAYVSGLDRLKLVGIAGLAGLWGATFSMLTTLRTRLGASSFDDLKLMKAFPVLLSRALIGASAACILFFFLLSGLLNGTAFPQFAGDLSTGTPGGDVVAAANGGQAPAASTDGGAFGLATARDLALLVVWCFLAGFSERLVPGLLASTEARAESGSDRFRPAPGAVDVPPPTPPQVVQPDAGAKSGDAVQNPGRVERAA